MRMIYPAAIVAALVLVTGARAIDSPATAQEAVQLEAARVAAQQAHAREHRLRVQLRKERRKARAVARTYRRLRTDLATIGLYLSPRESSWLCIHSHEGAWTANTGNGYFGGLQMDRSFQSTYGPEFIARWGSANNWPVWAQIKAADRAWIVRGFRPWPNTARMCGLL